MNKPDSQRFSTSAPTSRLRMALVLGAIGVGVVGGYECGQGSRDQQIQKLKDDLLVDGKRLSDTEKSLGQCRRVLQNLVNSKRSAEKELERAEKQLAQPDEALCVDVTAKALREQATHLANLLGITNQNDIDALMNAMRKGYTKVDWISADGSHLTLVDSSSNPDDAVDLNSQASINLEEPIESIPTEYLSDFDKVEKTEEELVLEQQIEDGLADKVVSDFDLESIRPSSEDPDSIESKIYNSLRDLQSDLSKASDPDIKKDLFCRFLAVMTQLDIAEENEEGEPSSELSTDDIVKSRILSLYLQALGESMGVEDADECLLNYNKLPRCYSLEGEVEPD